jgi:hypothetical protein
VCTHYGIHSIWASKGSGNPKPFPRYIKMKKNTKTFWFIYLGLKNWR